MSAATPFAVLFLALATAGWSPAGAQTHAEDEHGDEDDHADEQPAVSLTTAELEEFGIEVDTAAPGSVEMYVSLPGEVRPNADRVAHIVPRYSGIVTEVRASIGDLVRQGDVLAIVESDESLAPFEVKTLISGTVIEKHMTLGEAVSRDQDGFVIADLNSVWINLTVHQRDMGRVAVGQVARIAAGHELPATTGRIDYITPVVDETTRTATARVVIPNPDGAWRPGLFVTGDVLVERSTVPVAVPRTALFTVEAETVVFIETPEGFRPQPVTLGRAGDTHIEVVSGLRPDQRYASHGGFTLKAELQKASFGDGHAH
jgi:cobalt-zinc-cadmium efflux system membrane fusion protein